MKPTNVILWAMTAPVLFLGACCETKPAPRSQPAPIAHGPLPTYAQIAAAYNARVEHLDQVGANVGVVVHAKDQEGNPLREQVEGNLQLALPANVALSLRKVGETVFYLGSNDNKYWWFDLTGDKTAMVGRHIRATPETVAAFGLPVHPLDLLEVLAIKPIPNATSEQGTHAALAWSDDGQSVILTLPGRWDGQRRFFLDPKSFDPSRIELLDKSAQTLVAAALSRYVLVEVAGNTLVHPRMPSQFDIELPQQQATTALNLYQVQNPGAAQKPKVFDVDKLLEYYRIKRVMDLDSMPKQPKQARAGS